MKYFSLQKKGAVKSSLFLFMYIATLPYTMSFLIKAELWQQNILYNLFLILSYAAIYIAPAFFFSHYTGKILSLIPTVNNKIVISAQILIISLLHLLLCINLKIYKMFGFYFNSFVWNIIFTPGGIASLGATLESFLSLLLIFILIYTTNLLSFFFLLRFFSKFALNKICKIFITFLILISIIERLTFAMADFRQNSPILVSAAHIPFHQPLTLKSIARKLGCKIDNSDSVSVSKSALLYPREKLIFNKISNPLNIVWIVGESLRADMLNDNYMPDLYSFASEALNFRNHYSGGNGTRMGIFSMFYGLSGAYWFDFLRESKKPVLINRLQNLGYQLHLSTSARFSYPEFNRTVFAGVNENLLHESDLTPGWKRDRELIDKAMNFIKERDKNKPFMTFHFMESPHAPYRFPDEAIINNDFIRSFNYATTNIKKNIRKIFNRYINSCYNFNLEVQRYLSFLAEQKLLQNTIVIITGDHGEEFMEKGFWGHNSSFVEEQIRTPLIIYIPGKSPAIISKKTSHMDIAPTILKLLGLTNPPTDFSQGFNLLQDIRTDRKIFLSGWSKICVKDDNYKLIFPLNNYLKKTEIRNSKDQLLSKKNFDKQQLSFYRNILLDKITCFRKKS